MKACIVSFYMSNIDPKTVELQRKVVQKFNPKQYQHFSVLTQMSHADSMNLTWLHEAFKEHDTFLFLDIDAVPLSERTFDVYFDYAQKGYLVGGAQRSNHIQNNEHVFCAPSNVALTRETYQKMGYPNANPNHRGDVAEEWTFAAREHNVPVQTFLPLRYSRPVNRMDWETDKSPCWHLATGMPGYGKGTVYGDKDGELFYHNFQIFHPGEQELFQKKCEELLNG